MTCGDISGPFDPKARWKWVYSGPGASGTGETVTFFTTGLAAGDNSLGQGGRLHVETDFEPAYFPDYDRLLTRASVTWTSPYQDQVSSGPGDYLRAEPFGAPPVAPPALGDQCRSATDPGPT